MGRVQSVTTLRSIMVVRMSMSQFKGAGGLIKTKSAKQQKYGNKITEYEGRKYHSRKEADYARELDLLKRAKNDAQRVLEWHPQVRYDLAVNNVPVTTYVLDFRVHYADGRVEYIDVKGQKNKKGDGFVTTAEYTIKKKLMKALYDIEIIEV